MYKVFYNHKEYEFEHARQIISFIISRKCLIENNSTPQLIRISLNETKDFLEVGMGLEDKSILFFSPISDIEDKKISCNKCKSLINCSNDIMLKTFNGDFFYCSEYNLIGLQEALGAIEYFLKYKKPSKQISWYAY